MGESVHGRGLRLARDDEARAAVRLQVGDDGIGERVGGGAARGAGIAPTPAATARAKASIAAGGIGRR